MAERNSRAEERRLRRAAEVAARGEPPEQAGEPEEQEDDSAPGQRLEQQALWVDLQVRRAIERGEFDNLPGTGKPIPGLSGTHDPNWWVKKLIEREQITGVLPPALALRKEDAELDSRLDALSAEPEVRRVLADFNARVVDARLQLLGGPPVITATRDADAEVDRWQARRGERKERARQRQAALLADMAAAKQGGPRRWWRRRRNTG